MAIFEDVLPDHPYGTDIATLYKLGIIQGVGNNLFEPDRLIKREEFVVMVSNFSKVLIADCCADAPDKFSDLILENNSEFNRDDFYSLDFKDREQISFWAREAYELMDVYVIYDEDYDAYFLPQSYVKKHELAKLFFGLLEINLGTYRAL